MLLFLAFASAADAAGLRLEGEAVQGGLLRGLAGAGCGVTVDGEPVRVSAAGVFLVAFGRDDSETVTVSATCPGGESETLEIRPRQRTYDVQRIDGLPASKVNPDESVLVRIRAEAERVAEARRRDDPRTDFLTGFMWPVRGRITGVYGSQRVLNGEPRQPHFGIDIAAPVGAVVVAPADGVVSLVHEDMYFSGGTLLLDHGHGLSSALLHLSRILVEEGEAVLRGQPVAEVGATGRVTGAHLDWRVNLFDKRIDPALLVPPED